MSMTAEDNLKERLQHLSIQMKSEENQSAHSNAHDPRTHALKNGNSSHLATPTCMSTIPIDEAWLLRAARITKRHADTIMAEAPQKKRSVSPKLASPDKDSALLW